MSANPDISPKDTTTYVHFHTKRMAELKEKYPALTYEGRNNLTKAEWAKKKESPCSTRFYNWGRREHTQFGRRIRSENYIPDYEPKWSDSRVTYSQQVATIQNQSGFFEEEIDDEPILVPSTFKIDSLITTNSSIDTTPDVIEEYFIERTKPPEDPDLEDMAEYFADEEGHDSDLEWLWDNDSVGNKEIGIA
jgi:hypothetical protein